MNEPGDSGGGLTAGRLLMAALLFVPPVYAGLALLFSRVMGPASLLDQVQMSAGFALCAAVGLGAGVLSFPVRRRLETSARTRGAEAVLKPLFLALALAETPAFLGLLYFVAFRDWTGFWLLLAAAVLTFIAHARAPRS